MFFMAIQSALDLVKAAKQGIENLTPQQVAEEIKNKNVVLVDIREPNEDQRFCTCSERHARILC